MYKRKYQKMLSVTLAMVMVLLCMAYLPIQADTATATATTSTTDYEEINTTSGYIELTVGRTYRLVHDNGEISSLLYMGTEGLVSCQSPLITALQVGVINDFYVSYMSYATGQLVITVCQVVIKDVEGIIDLSRGNVFVEKGKTYAVKYGTSDMYTLSCLDTAGITIHSAQMFTANQTGSFYLWGNYFNEDNQYVLGACTVDVFEAADVEDGEYFIGLWEARSQDSNNQTNDNAKFMAFHDDSMPYSELHALGSYKQQRQKMTIMQNEDGYYTIRYNDPVTNNWYYLSAEQDGETVSFPLVNSGNVLDSMLWKILLNHDSQIVLVPKDWENESAVLTYEGYSPRTTARIILQNYYGITKPRTWSLYSNIIRLNHYFDMSLQDNSLYDATVLSLIPDATAFVRYVYQLQYGFDIQMGLNPTRVTNAIADSPNCPSGIDEACDCSTLHHKNVEQVLTDLNGSRFPRENREISVLWADRNSNTYCVHETNGHSLTSGIAVTHASIYSSSIAFLKITKSYSGEAVSYPVIRARMSVALAHEMVHLFGVYGEPAISEEEDFEGHDSSVSWCVMKYYGWEDLEEFYEHVMANEVVPICSTCVARLEGKIYGKAFRGNQSYN